MTSVLLVVAALIGIASIAGRMFLLRATLPTDKINNPELLRNKTVLITGITSGIGEETAKALYKMGANLIVGARSKAKADKSIENIKSYRSTGEK
ncbi:retinol dehydrogenase [Acrasis kona]|uniref:Retinol dehydrogenase n=1 Tax=Acrasis kona TaxID=1008807 RepID=A0AAW2ZPZ5_9EUKA